MEYVKVFAKATLGAVAVIAASDNLSGKLPEGLAIAGKDLRPYLGGGAALVALALIAHKFGM
jgi:hypothetical protein